MKHHRVCRSAYWSRRFHPVFLLFLLVFNTSVLQAALVTKYIAWYWDGFPYGSGLTDVEACTDLAAKMTAFGYPRVFHSIVASPSEVSEPCADDFWGINYPACQLTGANGPPSFSNCTDHAWVYSVVVDIPECTIRLSGPGGTNGALADVEPGKAVGSLRADVTCDGVPTSKDVVLTVKADANTGGHNHVPGRPDGVLSPGGGNSPLTFSFVAPPPAGDHTITARCADNSCGSDTGKVWVGIHGLVNIPSSGFWNLIPNVDTAHPANKHLTGAAMGKLAELARLYTQVYFPLNTPVLQLNDASLERGGLFDLGPNYGYTYWNPQHHEHRRGSVIDIQANGGSLAIPKKNFEDFRELLISQKMKWEEEKLNASGGHFHVRLRGVAE